MAGRNHIAVRAGHRLRAVFRAALLLLLFACPLLTASALGNDGRHYMVSGWDMDDGLPHNLVHAIAQDREGFLWMGTWEGVVRFNGRHFTVFDRQNTPGMELSGVFSIVAEADGGVLFGTANDGVFRYHAGRWQRLGGDDDASRVPVTAMRRDRDGSLWVASSTRLLRMEADGRMHEVGADLGLPQARILVLAEDGDRHLLVGTEVGAFVIRDGRAEPWAADWAGGIAVRSIAADGNGGWLVASDDGVRWRHSDGRLQRLAAGQRVDTVLRDRIGAVWMNLSVGSVRRHSGGSRDETLVVPGNVSPALVEDREGLVWVGSTDGLFRISEVGAVGFTSEDGLDSNYVRVMLHDPNGSLWIGHANGLNRWNRRRMSTVRLTPGSERDSSVLSLAWRDGTLWAGTYGHGVFRLDSEGHVRGRIGLGGHSEPLVRALLADADGGLWIGGSHGLSHYRDGRLQAWLESGNDPQAVVQALYRDADGTLWVGTTGGMAAIDRDGGIRHWKGGKDIPAGNVFDFLRDSGGVLWIATDRGLLRLHDGGFRVYDHTVGLPRDKLFRIIEDWHGSLWLSSNHGVFRIARNDFDRIDDGSRKQLAVHVVDRSDGMPGNQGNGASMPAGWLANNGALLFPTSAGMGLVDPRIAGRQDGKLPPVVFESVSVDGIEQPPGAALRLEPGTRRVAIGYAALYFRAPDKLRYRYRLHGFDAGWVEAGTGTEALYTNLPPGNYRLEVQAMTMPLDWERQEDVGRATMTLEVVPPFWQRRSLQVLGGLLLAGIVGLGFWLRIASYRRNQRHLNREITARTEELRQKNQALEVADHERDVLMRKLAHQANHDELTHLPNRRATNQRLRQAITRAREQGTSLCVALVDVDHFKRINDTHGHEVGDLVLQQLADVLREMPGVPETVFVSRHGGEEFLLVLEGMEREVAQRLLQAVHERIGALRIHAPGVAEPLAITVSIGAACLAPGQDVARTLLAAADRQMYRAKHEGRNRVIW